MRSGILIRDVNNYNACNAKKTIASLQQLVDHLYQEKNRSNRCAAKRSAYMALETPPQPSLRDNRGRTAGYPTAPSQIPACGITAPGSSKLLALHPALI